MTRKLFTDDEIQNVGAFIPQGVTIAGGTITAPKGLKIDGAIEDCTIHVLDGLMHLSATGNITRTQIKTADALLEGDFEGTLDATGKLELGSSCRAAGIAYRGDDFFMHGVADADGLSLKKARPAPAVQNVAPTPSAEKTTET